MENYKVRVSNEVESKEVQGLFEQLGLEEGNWTDKMVYPFVICNWVDGEFSNYRIEDSGLSKVKELTIDQFRDLVAAKTKKIPYLVKTIDKWEEQQLTSDTPESATCLKIPDDAIKAYLNYGWTINFVNSDDDFMNSATRGSWVSTHRGRHSNNTRGLVWQRTPTTMHTRCATVPTQPEELPFIDDEPKMTDINQTLNERQSQYGSFKDVANTTQSLYSMLLNGDMTDVELEALHMICSKLSRIRHGDCHKIDSWHDIGGYATLVVKDLEQNNG